MTYFRTEGYSVGYDGKVLIDDINISVEKGGILCLIGPNGSGKSTILKSITRQLAAIGGCVYIERKNLARMNAKELARHISVMLTERIAPELTTCEEVVQIGRYPYTNSFGMLSKEDHRIVEESMKLVRAYELKDRFFDTLSDGQKQRVLLAKALCQQPQVLILDEPTSFLDIRHKLELVMILRRLAVEKGLTVVLSLHEIDLAAKLADTVVLVNGEHIRCCGMPEDVLSDETIAQLYGLDTGHFDAITGSVEMPGAAGDAQAFVAAGNGCGIRVFRALQKRGVPFAAGILMQCDVDHRVAVDLAAEMFASEAFEPPISETIERAQQTIERARFVVDAGMPIGQYNQATGELLKYAVARSIPVFSLRADIPDGLKGMIRVESVEDMSRRVMKLCK